MKHMTPLFFPSYPSFPLEGKSRKAGKGVRGRAPIGCSIVVLTANRRPPGRSPVDGFRCPRQRHIKLPSEPARSVGRTHRSVRSTRTIEPGRRKAPEPSSPSGLVHKACQPSGILESIAPVPVPISTAPQALQTLEPSHRKVRQTSAAKRLSNRCPQKRAALTCSFLP